MARIIRAMTCDGSARAAVADTRDIVTRATEIHGCMPTAAAALGRTLTAGSLMGCLMPEKTDLLSISFRGDGEGGHILVSSDYCGNVRGCIDNPLCDPPRHENGKLNVGACVGKGLLYVMRDTGAPEPYVGTSDIVSGEIAEDIASYYAKSEQLPTLCALGVLVSRGQVILAAGGALIQMMPNADPDIAAKIEANAASAPSVTSVLAEGTPEMLLANYFKGIEYDIFDEIECGYVCPCSRERTDRALISLGVAELTDIAAGTLPAVMTCRFCDKIYEYNKEELEKLIEECKQ